MHESDWVSAHVFYHENLDALLTNAAGPLIAELAGRGLAEAAFFLRYWDGGPHLRFRALPTGPAHRAEVERVLAERFEKYLAENPAGRSMSQRDYAGIGEALAQWEGLPGHTERLFPNNSVAFIPYRREHDRYGTGASMEAVERHFAESSRIALGLLRDGLRPADRTTAGAAMILLTWFCGERDAARLAPWVSIDQDRPGDIPEADRPGDVTEADRAGDVSEADRAGDVSEGGFTQPAARATERRRERVIGLARGMRELATHLEHVSGPGSLADWARSVSTLRDALAAEAAAGRFEPPPRGWEGEGAVKTRQVLTVLDICAHLVCNRLGVTVQEEGAVRRLCADAVAVLAEEGR
ncbi:lantibiotic dehydratase C-terminal domain-containing protein [Nonomuraea sp. NPDC050680]|uniref:lantibiotic dehydratase C-terminal domain-containing protein n=1 Tax=Nonomuraea sp. NPDC050680 TaxID=3154630 RepID=UPI0033F42117